MGGDHVGDRECDGDQRRLPELDLAGPWGGCLSLPFLMTCMGPAAEDKGSSKVHLAAWERGRRRVRGEAGCRHRQPRMLAASRVILLLLEL